MGWRAAAASLGISRNSCRWNQRERARGLFGYLFAYRHSCHPDPCGSHSAPSANIQPGRMGDVEK